jgi:glutamate-1-semialdehyde 2,1-aminomutase
MSSNSSQKISQALEEAKARYVVRNAKSKILHEEATKSFPGGNTRTVLHTSPFPISMKSGKGYQLTSEDGHV